MTPTFKEIKAARGKCHMCGGNGLKSENNKLTNLIEIVPCPTCHETGNKILTFLIPIDVPDGYIFYKLDNGYGKTVFWRNSVADRIYRELPYKIDQIIPVICDACKRTSFTDPFITSCMVCNGSPETTLTVIDIQVVKTDQWYFSVQVLEV